MPYEFYKVLHILCVVLLFISLTGWLYSGKTSFKIMHGITLIVILVSGFGLAARMGLFANLPKWIWVKLGVWLLLGAAAAIIKRQKLKPATQIVLWTLLGGTAVFMAIYKPVV